MNIENILELHQEQRLSQFQLQSLEILSLSNAELQDLLQEEYRDNPLMEHQSCSEAKESLPDYFQYIAAPEHDRVKCFILEQLNPQIFSRQEWHMLKLLAGYVDERGLLSVPEREKRSLPPLLLQRCLTVLRSLEPAGLCMPSVSSCLEEQLRRQHKLTPEMQKLIRNHLKDIGEKRWKTISEALHMNKKQILNLVKELHTLHPYPLKGFFSSSNTYIQPDIIIKPSWPEAEIILNDHWMGTYNLSDYYSHMMYSTDDPDLKEYFQKKHERCSMIIQQVEQRRHTLIQLSRVIWNYQKPYLCGKGVLRPMTLQEIADQSSVHPSTVSRAIKGKYLQAPGGTKSLKALFQQGCGQGEGAVSQDTVKKHLVQLVAREDRSLPYSDTDLSRHLSEQCGLPISRRVVTKYRLALHIANSYDRRMK